MIALKALKALADETRLRLILVLSRYELSVNEIVTLMDMGQSRISRHLKILVDAGLLEFRRDGLWVYYSAVPSGKGKQFLDSLLPFALEQHTARTDLDMATHLLEERARKTRQFFNAIAEDWDALNTKILGDFDLPRSVLNKFPANCKTAVDLGCGTGNVLEVLRHKAENTIGVDGSSRMLELARRRFSEGKEPQDLSLRIGELDHIPLRDAEANFACINLVLHHIPEPKLVLTEIKRILQPKSTLLITEFRKHTNENMRSEYGDRWLGFDEEDFIQIAQEVGFHYKEVEIIPVKQSLFLFQLLLKTP